MLSDDSRLRVFKSRVLRKIFRPKRHKVTGKWGRLLNKELYYLYLSLNIIQVIKSRSEMGRACSTCGGGERRGACRVLVGKSEGRDHFEDIDIDGMIILKCILKKWDGGYGQDWCESR
jgi:hypothetical protein